MLKIDIMPDFYTSGSQIGTKVCYVSLQNVSKYVFITKKDFVLSPPLGGREGGGGGVGPCKN